jgi:hypothetical protein
MNCVVIDTNVLMVANEDFPPEQVSEDDIISCIERLEAIQNGSASELVVLDYGDRLLDEYNNALKSSK